MPSLASVGRSFSLETLVSVTKEPRSTVNRGLDTLARAGLIHRRRDFDYGFKHALVRVYPKRARPSRER